MNFRLLRLSPFIVGAVVGMGLMLLEYAMERLPSFDFLQRLEWVTFDWRVGQSLKFQQPAAENLGAVYVDNSDLVEVRKKLNLSWPFPRAMHGAVLKELTDQKAAGVAYDIFFVEPRDGDRTVVKLPDRTITSDAYFAEQIKLNDHVILGAKEDSLSHGKGLKMPAPIFAEAASGIGHAVEFTDADGVVRRIAPFFKDAEHHRTWLLGLELAAKHLGLNLDRADVDRWEIRVPDVNGQIHRIPLDGEGRMVIRWVLPFDSRGVLLQNSMSYLLGAGSHRRSHGGLPEEPWKDRLVVVGSAGTNPPIADRGPTPAGKETPFFSIHWNIANSLLTGAYVRPMGLFSRLAIIAFLVPIVGLMNWRLKAIWTALGIFLLAAAYLAFCMWSYVRWGWWLPVALPVGGAILLTYALMVVYRFFFERTYRRRLRGLFSPLLAPDTLELLLQLPNVSWAPQEKVMTVFFADIRGFTALTDQAGEGLEASERAPGSERAALETVNVYLSAVVEALKRHGATLDKYMGDSVMAFWGAPLDQPGHAAAAVRAAIEVQQVVSRINKNRDMENERITASNAVRAAQGDNALPLLPKLTLGTGINTGLMTVGFMGAASHLSNYTVFGRAVNIASRLEGASGSQRIYVTQETREAAVQADPTLAQRMRSVGEIVVKGISAPQPTHEVLWSDEGITA